MTSDHFSFASQLWREAGLQYQQMKAKLIYLLVPALACVSQFAPAVFAQQPPDRPDRPFRQFQSERRARLLANLTEDERARLRAAHQKALTDPAVQAAREKLKQARREFREVLRPALLKADPSIQPILDKLRAERPDRAEKP
jgi:Spy/CpxP family protein refolding chaperone